jgi:hypothetical protein
MKESRMERRERRIHHRKVRRIGIAVASVAMLGATLGLSGVATANGSGGRHYQCDPGPNTVGQYASNYRNYNYGNASNACD